MFLIGLLRIKCLKKLDNAVFSDDDVVFVNEDSDNATFFSDDRVFNALYLHNINLDDDTFDNDDPEATVHVILMDWCEKYIQYNIGM